MDKPLKPVIMSPSGSHLPKLNYSKIENDKPTPTIMSMLTRSDLRVILFTGSPIYCMRYLSAETEGYLDIQSSNASSIQHFRGS